MVVRSYRDATTKIIANNQSLIKFCIVLVFLFGLLLYAVDISSILPPQTLRFRFPLIGNGAQEDEWTWNYIHEQDVATEEAHQSYFVNTAGCRMPVFEVLDANIEKFLSYKAPTVCKQPLIRSNHNALRIALNRTEIAELYNVENVEDMDCYFEAFFRKDDFSNETPEDGLRTPIPFGEDVLVKDEFVCVVCVLGETEIYRDYHFFIPDNVAAAPTEPNVKWNGTKANVMIIGLDSVSRLNFHRQMNDTVDVLLNEMKAIELFGYNKVADNTYPNLMPALTGLDEEELQSACMPNKNETFDQCHFIWDDFKHHNYTTVYGEDMAWLGLFHYLKPGFRNKPTDIYTRPALIEMEARIASQKDSNAFMCLGGRRPIDVLLGYITKFLNVPSALLSPYFSFFWSTAHTHDYFNSPTTIDKSLATFLRYLSNDKAMENTFLMVMSDHGLRWGSFRNTYQGSMEDRQPFLFIVPPTWFPNKFPTAMKNLVRNRRRLTTHFDLYETMRDLYDLTSLNSSSLKQRSEELREADPMPRGVSLFLPVPENRTCYTAGISSHWCTCHEKQDISKSDPRVVEAARKMVNTMNELLETYPRCHKLSLNSISDANLGVSNNAITNMTSSFSDVTVRLQTKPGYGEFEATVRVHENGELLITGSISRTNLYGKQSNCIDEYHMKLYCFCDN